jgi:hypothetical protein
MKSLRERVEEWPGGFALKSTGMPLDEVLELFERGRALDAKVQPEDLIAAVTVDALGGEMSQGLTLAQAAPKRSKLVEAVSGGQLAARLPGVQRTALLALEAGLLQILDAWDASHEAAQAADDLGERDVSAYWHGIAHRREPDASNATYWFRRVGRHSLFASLVEPARAILSESACPASLARLLRDEAWDPFAFIDSCAKCRPGSTEEPWLRRIQRLEMARLMDQTARVALPSLTD